MSLSQANSKTNVISGANIDENWTSKFEVQSFVCIALAVHGIGSVTHKMQAVPAESEIEPNAITCANTNGALLHVE